MLCTLRGKSNFSKYVGFLINKKKMGQPQPSQSRSCLNAHFGAMCCRGTSISQESNPSSVSSEAPWPWASLSTSPCLIFLIYKMGIISIPGLSSWGCFKDEMNQYLQSTRHKVGAKKIVHSFNKYIGSFLCTGHTGIRGYSDDQDGHSPCPLGLCFEAKDGLRRLCTMAKVRMCQGVRRDARELFKELFALWKDSPLAVFGFEVGVH